MKTRHARAIRAGITLARQYQHTWLRPDREPHGQSPRARAYWRTYWDQFIRHSLTHKRPLRRPQPAPQRTARRKR